MENLIWQKNGVQKKIYEAELQKVIEKRGHLFRIDSILKYRGKGVCKGVHRGVGPLECWPKKYNSWIPYKQLVSLQQT